MNPRSRGWTWLAALAAVCWLTAGCAPVYRPEELTGSGHWTRAKLPRATFAPGQTLRVLTWPDYVSQDVHELFERTYQVRIEIETGRTNHELLEKLQAPGAHYDIVTPTGSTVELMHRLGLLETLDHAKLPLLEDSIPMFTRRRPYDPENQVSVPYFSGALGFGFRLREVDGLPSSWEFWRNPHNFAIYSGRISLPDDARFTLGSALIYLGRSANETDRAQVEKAAGLLRDYRRYGNRFLSNQIGDALVEGDVLVAWMWSGDAARAAQIETDIRFLIPDGPAIVYHSSLCVPKATRNRDLAHFFINFLLIPQIAAEMTNDSCYMTTVTAARPFIDRSILNGPAAMMPLEQNRIELRDVGELAPLYEELFAELRAIEPEHEPSPLPPHLRRRLHKVKRPHEVVGLR